MRRRKLIAVVRLTMLVVVGAFVLRPRQDRITSENYSRIFEATDITRAEVEAILGPPGDYTTRRTKGDHLLEDGINSKDVEWRGDRYIIYAAFDSSGRLYFVDLYPNEPEDDSPLGDLLWRANRQWRRWFRE
jgi:hypothetical protein